MTSGLPIRICTQSTQSGAGGGVWHVLLVVVHALHVGPGQLEVRVCVIEPVCPCGQESVWVCDGSGVQDCGMIDGVTPSLRGAGASWGIVFRVAVSPGGGVYERPGDVCVPFTPPP